MAKKNKLNTKIIAYIVSAVVGIGAVIGSYFIGYHVAETKYQPVAANNGQFGKLAGVYKRSYYNQYNKSVDSYAILWDDGTCRYIESVSQEYSAKLDFSDRSQQDCKYTYDDGTRSGKIEVTYDFGLNGQPDPQVESYNFTAGNGSITIGGSSYAKIQ